jgi:heat shock protein HslJ
MVRSRGHPTRPGGARSTGWYDERVIGLRMLLVLVLAAAGCRSAAPPEAARPDTGVTLVGTSWTALQIDGAAVDDPATVTLRFDSATSISGRAACNRYTAGLTLAGDRLTIGPTRTTRMACPPPAMDQERRFLTALAAVTAQRREGDRLLLLDGAGGVRLVLVPAPSAGAAPRRRSIEEEARRRGVEVQLDGGTYRGCGETLAGER